MSDPLSVQDKAHAALINLRSRTDLKIAPLKHIKPTFTHADGTERPLGIRYYQVIGVLHLCVMARFVLGDDCGLGKTLTTLIALAYKWEKDPDLQVLIFTDKSAVSQWASEIGKFTLGVKAFPCTGTAKKRRKIQDAFQAHVGPKALILGYGTARADFSTLSHWEDYWVVFDEATAFKNTGTTTAQCCTHYSAQARGAWGLTATLIQNRLLEGYGIYKALIPDLFGSKTHFMKAYSITDYQRIPGGRKILVTVGHEQDHIDAFKEAIDPFYLGRAKWEVATELPALTIKTVEVPLSKDQEDKYREALQGVLVLGDGEVKETDKLTQIIYCQEIVNHLGLIGFDKDKVNPRLEALVDMITTGDFAGEKVIVTSRFSRMIGIIAEALLKAGVQMVQITGADNDAQRQRAREAFQDPASPVQVIGITAAGGQAVNLQAAKAIIFYDTDFSGGLFLQKIGRMIRIGSEHDKCYAVHMVGVRARGKTVDHRTMEVLTAKMGLIEGILGRRIKGEGEEALDLTQLDNTDVSRLFDALQADARELK